jgi:hypothetical protein
MAKKMYYTEAEATKILGVSAEQLAARVRDGKLRAYQSGGQKMYKADEVDSLGGAGEEEIELSPAGDEVDLSKAGASKPPGKEDTVITAAGISIFDDEELEIEPADPMAKTQITPSLEEQINTEGAGSGSGLLDLTRESDDTSLGAEVLDHIDVEGGLGSSIAAAEAAAAPEAPLPTTVVVMAESPAETMDASSGLFGGIIIASAVVAVAMVAVVVAAAQGLLPGYVEGMKENIAIVLVGTIFLLAVGAVAGWMIGKGAAARQAAMKTMAS